VCGIDNVSLDLEIVPNEISRSAVVRMDSPDSGGGQDHTLGSNGGKEFLDCRLNAQVKFLGRAGSKVLKAQRAEASDNG
jgi:hypothetical protein